ncbi:hypothetical protein CHU98_g4283 [Xylaria longipes]|nr:hypothetical protein CHU98_g4283 [Xylaria longipes]
MKHTLLAIGEHTIHDRNRIKRREPKTQVIDYECATDIYSDECEADLIEEHGKGLNMFTRYELEEQASCLDEYFEDGRNDILRRATTSKPMLSREVLSDIQKWIKIPTGIECDYEIQPKKTISTAVSKRQATLIALLYLVTGQLIWLLPSTFESRLRTDEVIGSLDGRFASAAVALDLIEALLEHIPPMLLVIIDKLNLADSPETRPYLTRLIAMLRGQDTTKVIKTLFTTAGSCAVLAKTTTRGERADAGRMVQGKPGQHLRGWSSVGNLKLT